MNDKFNDKVLEFIRELSEKHHKGVEELTKEQFESTLVRMIEAGDFARHVFTDSGHQAITYTPFRQVTELQLKIEELKEIVELLKKQKYELEKLLIG